MDSGVVFILSMLPFAITGIAVASMFEKKKRKEEEEHQVFLKKTRANSKVISMNQYKS